MKKIVDEVLRQFEEKFNKEEAERRKIHDETVEGLIKPMLENGLVDLVDDVEFGSQQKLKERIIDLEKENNRLQRICNELSVQITKLRG